MLTEIPPYLGHLKKNVKNKISGLLNSQTIHAVVTDVCKRLEDKRLVNFHKYYLVTVAQQDNFMSTDNFFQTFKQQYSLQGITNQWCGLTKSPGGQRLVVTNHN